MPFQISAPEILLVLAVALIVLGPKRLPEAARSVGKGIREFKDSITDGGKKDDEDEDLAAAYRLK